MSDENDNSAFNQFIWSPFTLTNDVSVNRAPAPPASYIFPQPNCDGFQYTRTGVYAYGVAICPVSNDDYELKLYDDYTGSEQGFDSLRAYTRYPGGYTDYAIATYSGVEPTVYPGVYHYLSTPGSGNFVIHAVDATGRILNTTDETRRDTLTANRIINVYEVQLSAGTEYTITTEGVSGSADVHLYLYGPDYGYYGRGNYVEASYNIGTMDEEITYTPATTSYHVIVVCKPNYVALPEQVVYDISVGLSPPNLTTSTPSGWDFPAVPRNVSGAIPGSCVLTDTLPGNSSGTYLNFSSYNEGPVNIPSSYWDYIFIDNVSWYGESIATGQPPGFYALLTNRTSPNDIKGGRHTMGLFIDRNDDVVESDETDNWYQRQFIWTPYILSDYVPVTRTAPPEYGNGPYPNCDGFEMTTSYWGAAGIMPLSANDDYNLRLHDGWITSENGFGNALALSGWGMGYIDFVLYADPLGSGGTYDVSVVQDFANPGTNNFVIQQANKQVTWYNTGTYGPYSFGINDVMGIWEVNLPTPGTYTFQVDVTAGNANLGTSIYQGDAVALSKSGYFTGGYSNTAGAGGDESFTIVNHNTDM